MTALTITEARKNFYQLVDSTAHEHKPILIRGKRNNAVLIGEEDWRSIQETLYLSAIPGMVASLKEGMQTPISEMSTTLDW